MADKRSTLVFTGAREAQSQFDYFLAGVAGALFAYIAQTYAPQKLALSQAAFEPAALVFLGLSFYLGLKRIEVSVEIGRVNHEMLDFGEKAGEMTKALAEGFGRGGYNAESGELLHPQAAIAKREHYMEMASQAKRHADTLAERGQLYYRLRNHLLLAGFISILLGKIFQPYV